MLSFVVMAYGWVSFTQYEYSVEVVVMVSLTLLALRL